MVAHNPLLHSSVFPKINQIMRQSLFSLLCLLAPLLGYTQNLVVNGGFERQSARQAGVWQASPKPCQFSGASDIVNSSAEGWKTFDVQTPDLLLWDSISGCPTFPKPRKGKRMMGLIMYHPFQDGQFAFDYHELIQGALAKPLEKGKTYRLSFWVYTNDSLGNQHLNKVCMAAPQESALRCVAILAFTFPMRGSIPKRIS